MIHFWNKSQERSWVSFGITWRHHCRNKRDGMMLLLLPWCTHARMCAQPCPTLFDAIVSSPPHYSVHGISKARMLEQVAISFSNPDAHIAWNIMSSIGSFTSLTAVKSIIFIIWEPFTCKLLYWWEVSVVEPTTNNLEWETRRQHKHVLSCLWTKWAPQWQALKEATWLVMIMRHACGLLFSRWFVDGGWQPSECFIHLLTVMTR